MGINAAHKTVFLIQVFLLGDMDVDDGFKSNIEQAARDGLEPATLVILCRSTTPSAVVKSPDITSSSVKWI